MCQYNNIYIYIYICRSYKYLKEKKVQMKDKKCFSNCNYSTIFFWKTQPKAQAFVITESQSTRPLRALALENANVKSKGNLEF